MTIIGIALESGPGLEARDWHPCMFHQPPSQPQLHSFSAQTISDHLRISKIALSPTSRHRKDLESLFITIAMGRLEFSMPSRDQRKADSALRFLTTLTYPLCLGLLPLYALRTNRLMPAFAILPMTFSACVGVLHLSAVRMGVSRSHWTSSAPPSCSRCLSRRVPR